MKRIITVLLCLSALLFTGAGHAQDKFGVTYVAGSLVDLKAGTNLTIHISPDFVRIAKNKRTFVSFLPESIAEVGHGRSAQDKVPAPALASWTVRRKVSERFVRLRWGTDGQERSITVRINNAQYSDFLSSLEETSGKKAVGFVLDDAKTEH